MNEIELGPIRPPAEADSLLIRTTRGCPWNKCHFCTLFSGMRFSIRSVEEIKRDITLAKEQYGQTAIRTCFLQDGDSFAMQTEDLIEVLTFLKSNFPSLERISSYGRAQTMMRKSEAEIGEIHSAGLNMLYSGIESGSDQVLQLVSKGVTQEMLVDSLTRGKKAGMGIMAFIIFGLGGKELSQEHITGTSYVLNEVNANSVRVMSLAVKGSTELGNKIENGSFTMLSEVEMVEEQVQLLSLIDRVHCHYGNFHGINLLTEIEGVLPEDKDRLLSTLETFLSLPPEDQENFILGRRLGYYRQLSGFRTSPGFQAVESQLAKLKAERPGSLEPVFHGLRNRII